MDLACDMQLGRVLFQAPTVCPEKSFTRLDSRNEGFLDRSKLCPISFDENRGVARDGPDGHSVEPLDPRDSTPKTPLLLVTFLN